MIARHQTEMLSRLVGIQECLQKGPMVYISTLCVVIYNLYMLTGVASGGGGTKMGFLGAPKRKDKTSYHNKV